MSKVSALGKTPEKLTFGQYLEQVEDMGEKGAFQQVRAGKREKVSLPALIPAGVFSGGYKVGNLRRLNGMASFDIDKIKDVEGVKARLKELPWVYYLSKSVSGKGLWGLVQFKHPKQYVYQYSGLLAALEEAGIEADYTAANINRLRFYSYDPDHYLNEKAEVFTRMEMTLRSKDGMVVDYKVNYDYQFSKVEYWRARSFDEAHDCEQLFEQAGWDVHRANHAGQVDVLRPGSDKSRSGNIKDNKFWCFTESTSFKPNTLNTPFDCYVHLFCDGDVKKALREIR